jgi:hypothetical protein
MAAQPERQRTGRAKWLIRSIPARFPPGGPVHGRGEPPGLVAHNGVG